MEEENEEINLIERNTIKKQYEKETQKQQEMAQERSVSFLQRWKTHRDKMVLGETNPNITSRFFDCYTIYLCITYVHCGLNYWIPMYFTEPYGWEIAYYVKIFMCFTSAQVAMNWFCTKSYDSTHKYTEDRPDAVKGSLWDEPIPDTRKIRPAEARITLISDEANEKLRREINDISWKYCDICDFTQPPRAHHCKVCKRCVLKRDHHCYMTGVCIGHYNQRYFTVLMFYISLSMAVVGVFLFFYLRDTFYDRATFWDYILPVTIYNYWRGYYGHQYILCIVFLYSFCWVFPMTTGLFLSQMVSICSGLTPYEMQRKLSLKNTETLHQRFKTVFGNFYFWNLLIPAVIIYRQETDGTVCKNIKIVYKCKPGEANSIKLNMD